MFLSKSFVSSPECALGARVQRRVNISFQADQTNLNAPTLLQCSPLILLRIYRHPVRVVCYAPRLDAVGLLLPALGRMVHDLGHLRALPEVLKVLQVLIRRIYCLYERAELGLGWR